jgi:cytochrome b
VTATPTPRRIRIWDAPTRLFHWALVLLIATLWWTGEQRTLDWHRLAGYGVLGLLLFRLAWGFAGSTTARFSSFVAGPRRVARYVRHDMFRKTSAGHPGHNPLGGWSVVVMLVLLSVQIALGMVAVDVDGIESGPFSYLMSFEAGRQAAELHHLLFNLLLAVIALHVLASLFYLLYRREDLIRPMIFGSRPWKGEEPALTHAPLWRGLIVVAASGLLVWGLIQLYGQ